MLTSRGLEEPPREWSFDDVAVGGSRWWEGGHAENVLTEQEDCERQAYCKVLVDLKVDVLEGLEVTLLSSRNGAVGKAKKCNVRYKIQRIWRA
jgi:hypothetical protein